MKHLSFIAENQSKYFGVASYTKMRFWKLALRGGCLTSFYATLRTRSRGLCPCCLRTASPLSEGKGKPLHPQNRPFSSSVSVTLFCGRSSHKIVLLINEPLSAVLTRPTLCICKGFATFYDVHRPTRRATIWRGVRGVFVEFCL